MNHSIIIYMLGWIMNIEAALMLIPILTAVVYFIKKELSAVTQG